MLLAEGALAGDANLHRLCSCECQSSCAPRRASILAGMLGRRPLGGALAVLEDDVPDRGVRGRHGVEAIDLVDLVVERAAHDQPHHHLDAFGAGLAHVFEMRDARELLRVLGEVVEEGLVELAVDQAGARPADLVRHAAGAEDHDPQVLRIGLDRLADRLAEHEAAMPGRRRIEHHVDRERDDRARPFLRRAEHQVHRHGQAVIDLHLVADGEIELVEDDRLRDVRGELRMALHHRHRARSPAFVGGREFRRAAEREGRDDLDRERRGVIVVDDDGDVGLGLRHPLLGFLEAREHPLPVRLLGLLVVDRRADRRHVRRRHSCDDPSHVSTSTCCVSSISALAASPCCFGDRRACRPCAPDLLRLPSTERPPASIMSA